MNTLREVNAEDPVQNRQPDACAHERPAGIAYHISVSRPTDISKDDGSRRTCRGAELAVRHPVRVTDASACVQSANALRSAEVKQPLRRDAVGAGPAAHGQSCCDFVE